MVLNTEYPASTQKKVRNIPRTIFEKVRGAVFYDVGFVNLDAYDASTANLNSNVGVGLRLFLPIGPIRVDFGVPTKSDEFNDSGGQFQFNVGYKF